MSRAKDTLAVIGMALVPSVIVIGSVLTFAVALGLGYRVLTWIVAT